MAVGFAYAAGLPMPVVSVANVRHGFGTHIVLDGATVSIEPGEKVGLVGRNGGGKSTLMKLIAGVWQPDFGTVSLARGTRVGYLSQDPRLEPTDTLRHAAGRAWPRLALHAWKLDLYHPLTDAPIAVVAPVPGDLLELVVRAGGVPEDQQPAVLSAPASAGSRQWGSYGRPPTGTAPVFARAAISRSRSAPVRMIRS